MPETAREAIAALSDKNVLVLARPRPISLLRALVRRWLLRRAHPSVSTHYLVGWAAVESQRRGLIGDEEYQDTLRTLARYHISEADIRDDVETGEVATDG